MADKRIKDLPNIATEADLTSSNYIPLDGSAGTKKVPGNLLAKKSEGTQNIHNLTEASSFSNDDYFVIDGATNNQRKMTPDVVSNKLRYPLTKFQDIKNLGVDGVCNFLYYGTLVRGLLNTDTGAINPAFPFRVASETWFYFGKELNVTIAAGFKAGWIYESSGTYYFSGFKSGSMTIPYNRTFRIAIQRDPEDQNEIADISEFGGAVTFMTDNGAALVELKKTLYKKEVIRAGSASVQPCVKITKSVGKKLYVRAKVILPRDFQSPASAGFIDVLGIKGTTATSSNTCKIRLYKQTTKTLTSDPKIPCPEYRAGIYATLDGYSDGYSRFIADGYNFTAGIGKDILSIRFAGDVSVAGNQDLMLKVDATTISIYHSTNNSVVASYDKEDYATAKAFYEQIITDIANGPLTDFECDWWNLDGYTLDDIIPFDVNLVAKYQNVKNGAFTEWRAFPCYFSSVDKDEHIIEVVFDYDNNVKAQFIMDGYGLEFPPLDDASVLNKIFDSDVEIVFGAQYVDSGTVDFVDYMVSDQIEYCFPLLRVYYAERVKKGLEGSSYYLSENKFTDLIHTVQSKGFGDLPMSSVLEYLRGHTLDNRKYFHFTHDDTTHDSTSIMDARERETYLRCDVTPSFGLQMEGSFNQSEVAIMKALRQCEWMYHIHTMQSTDPSEPSKSLGLFDYDKMVSLVQDSIDKFVELFGEFPLVWDFHEVSEGYNQVRYLMNRGFQLIFGDSGQGILSKANRYHCKRRQVNENTDFAVSIIPFLNNYIMRKRP